jgi:hypothetical protein
VAKEGWLHEKAIVEDLRGEGLTVKHDEVCPICSNGNFTARGIHIGRDFGQFLLTGHMDGLVIDKTHKYLTRDYSAVLEVKSKSQGEFERWMKERWRGFEDAATQLTVYMVLNALQDVLIDGFKPEDFDNLGTGLEALYVVKNRNTGFCDKFTQQGTPLNFSEILAKINTIEGCVQKGETVPVEPDWSSLRCKWCNYKFLCIEKTEVAILETVNKEAYLNAAQMWLDGYESKKHGEALMTDAERLLKGYAEAHSNDGKDRFSYRTGEVVVNGYPVKEYTLPAKVYKAGWRCSVRPM